jgi:leucyl aminopeptidase (aminopeptidase T)
MNDIEKIKMFKDVFNPKTDERILILIDMPHKNIKDTKRWKEVREMAKEWYIILKNLGLKEGFTVDIEKYYATGNHNAQIPNEIKEIIKKYNLVLAMTEFSASSSLLPICQTKGSITRCASMPMLEKSMEKTALKANYKDVKKYALILEEMLNNSKGAEILFSTGDKLYVDLRHRKAFAEAGDCRKAGQFINFPSGEACKAPYEAISEEIDELGESKTEGILPVKYEDELVKYIIKNNRITEIIGEGKKAEEMRKFFSENHTRRNIAEFALGCNPNAEIIGNILEDEKVGFHIAYGMSTHLGGKVKSDMHLDICYAKDCPIEGTTVNLIKNDGSKIEIVKDAKLRYELLK